ncbi:hypothetical protein KR026_010164 [Drosophila bipectinata]|nr:hypothetical protein KR026_010164 [Drosophila bipectinata]
MFRVGKLRRYMAAVAKGDSWLSSSRNRLSVSGSQVQRRCLHSRNYLQGVSNRVAGTPSATAQLASIGGSKQQKPSHPKSSEGFSEGKNRWPRKVFSGVQPTGSLHLGNYLGAVRKWVELQNDRDDVTICIVDLHSITLPHNPPVLRENIFTMAATLLSCGIDPAKSTLFVQSSVPEHAEFNWILSSLTTMPRLAQLPQFREKSRLVKDVPLGLYVYPVLQAADIMLYKATHVPVGADQLQHIQLAQHLARSYNTRYGETFPVCQALIEDSNASRVLSLRDPSKKMSKSEGNPKATINLCDSPEVIMQKIKKAVTDFTSDITFNPTKRPGVSNLVNIHALVTDQPIKSVVDEATTLDTAKYKERVAEAVIEHLRPIREQIRHHMGKRSELTYLLEVGAEKARQQAQSTLNDVKQRLGLGTANNIPAAVNVAPLLPPEVAKTSPSRLVAQENEGGVHERHERMYGFGDVPSGGAGQSATGELTELGSAMSNRTVLRRIPVVPTQTMRVEKERGSSKPRHVFKMDRCNAPSIGFKAPPTFPTTMVTGGLAKNRRPPARTGMGYTHTSQNVNPSAVSTVAREVNASKQQEYTYNMTNGGYYKTTLNASANRTSDRGISKDRNSPIDRSSPIIRIEESSINSIREAEASAEDEESRAVEEHHDEHAEHEEEKERDSEVGDKSTEATKVEI